MNVLKLKLDRVKIESNDYQESIRAASGGEGSIWRDSPARYYYYRGYGERYTVTAWLAPDPSAMQNETFNTSPSRSSKRNGKFGGRGSGDSALETK